MAEHTHCGAERQLPLTPDPDAAEHEARVARAVAAADDQQLATYLRPALDRLTVVENGIADFKARIPGMERECAAIRQNVTAVTERLARVA